MQVSMMRAKLHRATVTEANVNYVGSITIDEDLLDASGILINEKVQVVNVTNGNRLETYAIAGERGSGTICMNGAAAHLASPGDVVIIIAYALMDLEEAKQHQPRVIFLGEGNRITEEKRALHG